MQTTSMAAVLARAASMDSPRNEVDGQRTFGLRAHRVIELAIFGAVAVLGALVMWRRGRRPKKHCPHCGAYVDADAHQCKYCGHLFTPASDTVED